MTTSPSPSRRPRQAWGGGSRRSSTATRGSARGAARLPLAWLVVVYFGSLFVLLLSAFWETDPFTREVVHEPTLDNFRRIIETPVYRDVAWRTIQMAAGRDGRVRCPRVPDRVLHGTRRIATDAKPPRRRSPHAAVGELPREGVRVADDPLRGRRDQLGARAVRPPLRRALDGRALARLHVPLAARS